MGSEEKDTHVVIVGGGFAGVACAKELVGHQGVRVTLVDRNNYHQFQPLLYQVATSQLASADVGYSLRAIFHGDRNIDVVLAEVESVDPEESSLTTTRGDVIRGDVLVLAPGARAEFFGTPGAAEHSLPLYTLEEAERLRHRILENFEAAARDPGLIERGVLNFVVVGGGATGTEVSGALADLIGRAMRVEYPDLAVDSARIVLVDHGPAVLGPFSEDAHDYASKVLTRDGVEILLETGVAEVTPTHAQLSNGTVIESRCIVWGGGIAAHPLGEGSGLPVSERGRVTVGADLRVEGFPNLYVLGDTASIPDSEGSPLPQLGSVAQQSGAHAGKSIRRRLAGHEPHEFRYRDKGIMAMVGRNAAVAEIGRRRHEIDGPVAFVAWLGVHAALMSGVRPKVNAFMDWAWEEFSPTRPARALDRSTAPRIDWGESVPEHESAGEGSRPRGQGAADAS